MSGALTLAIFVSVPLVVTAVIFRHRRASEDMLLSALAVAAERQMPLAPAVDAFADEGGSMIRDRARRLAALLRSGATLPGALYQTPGLVSRQALAAIRVGHDSGALADALRDVVRSGQQQTPAWDQVTGRVLYLCGVLLFGFGVAVFMILRIAPELTKIFVEFDCELPPITKAVFGASEFLATTSIVWAVPMLLILLFACAIAAGVYVSGARWHAPLTGWLTRRLDRAAILEALALPAQRGLPLRPELELLSLWYPSRRVREQIAAVLRDLDVGGPWCESMVRHGLIGRAEHTVLQAAQRAGNLAWALREMAESNRRRFQYRMNAAIQVLFPLVVLSLGWLVLVHVVAYFIPLVALIQNLA
jgi:protein transport protein HofC